MKKFILISFLLIFCMFNSYSEKIESVHGWALPGLSFSKNQEELKDFSMAFYLNPKGEEKPNYQKIKSKNIYVWKATEYLSKNYKFIDKDKIYYTKVIKTKVIGSYFYSFIATVKSSLYGKSRDEYYELSLLVFNKQGAGELFVFNRRMEPKNKKRGETLEVDIGKYGELLFIIKHYDQGYSTRYDKYEYFVYNKENLYLIDCVLVNKDNFNIHPEGTDKSASYKSNYSYFYKNDTSENISLKIEYEGTNFNPKNQKVFDYNKTDIYIFSESKNDYIKKGE